MSNFKRGPRTKVENQFIEDNIQHKNYVEIAQLLNRDPETIKRYIEKNIGFKTSLGHNTIVKTHQVREKEFWPILESQFSPPELEVFIYHWDRLQDQFDGDILATEELQVIDLIKTEIMMNRNLSQQKDLDNTIKRIQLKIEMIDVQEEITKAEQQLLMYHNGRTALTKEHLELQKQKNKLFSDLKATRSARIDKIDSKRESFISWIEDLINNKKLRKELGVRMEKFRLAMDLEEIRLMEYHKYEDGKVDQPIFNEKAIP